MNTKKELIHKLQQDILLLEGFKPQDATTLKPVGLGIIEKAFPNGVFPTGSIHEFLSAANEEAAATCGFITGLLSCLTKHGGYCLWISTRRKIFPPALKLFGVNPEQVIFIDLAKEKDVLWTLEEALRCDSLSAVVGELGEISFAQSRRLQLAVEHSYVTGLIHCNNPSKIGNTTAVARWQIIPQASTIKAGMPGIGYPSWKVNLLKVKNGKPGTWPMQWVANGFRHLPELTADEIKFEKDIWYGKAIS